MGQSLTLRVFYGARMPDPERGGPRPRLTQAAVDAILPRPWPVDRGDINELEYHPAMRGMRGRIDFPRSGVGDYTVPHIAAMASVTTTYDDGISALAVTPPLVDDATHALIREALACLEWVEIDYDGDEEIERVVDAPEIAIGWHVAASYW